LEKSGEIIARNNWLFSQTISFMSEKLREEWEPCAPSIESRVCAFISAKRLGIKTWVSIEPVIDPEEAISVMKELIPHVDSFKVGKLNHNKKIESTIDWRSFLNEARSVLNGKEVYWKKDLLSAAGLI
jgi:DNA repair photolyase